MLPEEQYVENPMVAYAESEFQRVMLNDARARYAFDFARNSGLDEDAVLKCVIVALSTVTGREF